MKKKDLPKILVILGATASGKSDLAVCLAKKFKGELVSADSRQIYREMNIATAKLKPPRGIKQWMVDVAEPNQIYTLQDYKCDALKVINDILKRDKLPILVGGTALYIYAVAQNWQIPKVKPNKKLRAKLEKKLKTQGLSSLAKDLKKLNKNLANQVDLKNSRRVIRALEVALSEKKTKKVEKQGQKQFEVFKIGIAVPREDLKKQIKKRTEIMWKQGVTKETTKLFKKYQATLPSMSGIGYKEVKQYLAGEIDKKKCLEFIAIHSYQYSKRQDTWWKKDKEINWVKNYKESEKLVKEWLR